MSNFTKEQRRQSYIGRVEWASKLLNSIAPTGKIVGVEIGLWKADFARMMLEKNDRLYWFGIDPYFPYGKKRRTQPQWDGIYNKVVKKMEPFRERFTLIRKPSDEGVNFIPNNVDFVFVDGNHDYDMVWNDILLYEKKIRPGGILAGHDYIARVGRSADDYAEKFNRPMLTDTHYDLHGVFWWVMTGKEFSKERTIRRFLK